MNETTINALINLFALFSSISESKKEDAIRAFSLFVQLHLGISSMQEYLQLFEELLDFYGVGEETPIPIDKEQQARNISINVKGMLRKDEQIMLFLRFLELARGGNTKKAEGLFSTLSEVFEIPDDEYRKFSSFMFQHKDSELTSADFVVVNNQTGNGQMKHIGKSNLNGRILFLYSRLIGHFIFIYTGNDDITLGENPIRPGVFYAFREGSIIRGPRITPLYYIDIISLFERPELTAPFVFSADEVAFRFPGSENGLHTFSFSERSGQLIAVMGGSGVGKSTLINILNGNIPVQEGTIRINQYDIQAEKDKIEGLIGYVPQDDLLFEELTVKENLYYNACLCFSNLSDEEINAKVDTMLQELELFSFKDLKVGSPLKKYISGGQRKRLNVAMELIREPAILFVDEPTSGLSSTDSEMVMLLLKEQARKGKLILVNIHQPSSAIYKLFDKLWVMDKGGRPIYAGNPLDAVIYFKRAVDHVNADVSECNTCGNINPEQVLDIIEMKKIDGSGNFTTERRFSPEYWYNLFRGLSAGSRGEEKKIPDTLPETEMKKPGLFQQFLIFFRRNVRTKIADNQYLLINLLEAPLLALIVAYFTRYSDGDEYVFFENKNLVSYLFMSIVVIIFMGMSVSAEEIIKDKKILQREAFLSLSRFSYLNSKVLFLLLLSAFQSLAFVMIGNMIIGMNDFILSYWMVLFAVACCSNLIGLNISSALDSVVTIYILIPLLLIPQILLCGVIVKFDDLQNNKLDRDAVPIIGDVMMSRWAFEAMAVDQFTQNKYMVNFFDLDREIVNNRYVSDLLIPELTGIADALSILPPNERSGKEAQQKFRVLYNEVEKLGGKSGKAFSGSNKINADNFDFQTATDVKEYLNEQSQQYKQKSLDKQREKDRIINQVNRNAGNEYLVDLKMENHNASLEALMLNTDAKLFRTTPNGIMQKIAPVFKDPDYNNGRTHFLASEKVVAGYAFNTYWFNVMMIWIMSLFLYVALYYDWLRKAISFFSNRKKR